MTNTTLELSVFWPSDTESRINELRFSESISLLKTKTGFKIRKNVRKKAYNKHIIIIVT